jgi:hypothetical protein
LQEWAPQNPRLLLIGPSAGWTIPAGFLQRFAVVDVLDPDPLARLLLKKRFASTAFRFGDIDLFGSNGLAALASVYQDHALLFCNVLGQLAPVDDREAEVWCGRLRKALTGLNWASYHDLVSCARPPHASHARDFPAETSLEAVLASFWRSGIVEIRDHNCGAIARQLPFSCVPWQLGERQWHLVQWCRAALR